jgi:N-acylneuraminate cytidylyltransferase
MSNLCVIPARGGSKRIPRKNIKEFLGKPIIAYSIELALKSGLFDEVMVSTDDEEIAAIASEYGANVPFLRSLGTSNDYATTQDVLNEVIAEYSRKGYQYKNLCCIYPTAVLANVEDLKSGYEMLVNADMVMPITEFSFPPSRSLSLNEQGSVSYRFPEHKYTRSQDLEPWFHDAGQWYWYRIDALKLPLEKININVVIKSNQTVQDIDNLEDWCLAELKYSIRDAKL